MAVSTHVNYLTSLASLTHRTSKLVNSSFCSTLFAPNANQTSPSNLCSAVLTGPSSVSNPPFASFNELIDSLIEKKDLSESEAEASMEFLLSDTNEALISAFLVLLRAKGETYEEMRGVQDVFNIAGAGSATAATFGLLLPGSLQWRGRNMLLGSILGAAIGFPLGWAHLKLVEMANEGNQSEQQREPQSGVGAAIERLEENLN